MNRIIVALTLSLATWSVAANEGEVRLPPLSENSLDHISYTLGSARYPVSFRVLYDKLGGDKAMVWCCRISSAEKTTLQFAISEATAQQGRYCVEFYFRPSIGDPFREECQGARLAYESPYGTTFYAELLGAKPDAAPKLKKPNPESSVSAQPETGLELNKPAKNGDR